MKDNNLRSGWAARLFGTGGVGVPVEAIPAGHLLLEHDGDLLDLGPCTLEDLRMIAFVAQEAYVRLPSKRGRSKTTPGTLARVRNVTRQFWQRSVGPEYRSPRIQRYQV